MATVPPQPPVPPADTATRIRDAAPEDAAALAGLADRTFRATFGPVTTPSDLELHCSRTYGPAQQLREILDPELETLLAEAGGELVGYGQLGWRAAPSCVAGARPAEIHRLYVDARFHGRGVARDLMVALLGRAAAGDADAVWLGVWEHNERAKAFYRKWGFVEVGDHVFPVGDDPQRDLLMQRGAPGGL